ncbi:hypothetical protein F5X68DRAFT_231327 [Plectosphaerella plurivora]|uniref:Uncharacterized protein n=1 Tax=Plectosphaerella plurivora TaxID=936078 RepID=A0A9P9ACZ4_9PEZI|nr:hypothetical protein F5X68DRAFT_231327 [Plectosphaerella plurivora]
MGWALVPFWRQHRRLRTLGEPVWFAADLRDFRLVFWDYYGLLWLSGLVLFLQTSMVVVYDTAYSYEAVAGVGPFNSSLVDPFMNRIKSPTSDYDYNVLPYTYYSVVYNLVSNPVFANSHQPVDCSGPTCVSYVLSGGVLMSAHWQPTGYQAYPLLKLPSVPVMQLDFDTKPTGNNFTDMADCDLIGADKLRIGVRLCLARSSSRPGAVEAGLFICKEGVSGGVCNTKYSPTPNLTAVVSFHSRRADILASRTNSTILTVSDLTTPSMVPIDDMDLANYRKVLLWLLDYVAADIPAPSAIIEHFWTSQSQLATEHLAYGYLAQHFHSILAFPVWFLNVNNFGNIDLPSNDLNVVSPLSDDFLTTAHIVAPHTLIRFRLAMVIAFAVAQGLVLAFAWILLIWAMRVSASLPMISSYPIFDLVFKAETAINARSDELWDADDAKIETMLQGLKVNRNAM